MKNIHRILFALIALTGCGGGGGTDTGLILVDSPVDDTGPMRDTPMRDVPMRDAGPSNDNFAGARPVTVAPAGMMATPVSEAIEVPEDRDFWSFMGTAGDWITINTQANPMDNPMMVDTVITLYDASMTQVAENDDAVPRVNTDSEIVIRLPSTGLYYIEVEEFTTWMTGMPPEGDPSYTYDLTVSQLADGGGLNIDMEMGDDAATAQTLRFGGMMGNITFALGTFNDATDVDVYSFTVMTTPSLLSVDVMPSGPTGYGSTRSAGRVWVTDRAGTNIIARIEPRGMMQDDLSPSLSAGDYLLWVDAGGPTAGTNDHYVLKGLLGTENPVEMEVVGMNTNDTTATAEALMVTDTMGVGRAFILARLSATDTDVFSFTAPAGTQMGVFCGSRSSGIGLMGLRAELLGPDGTTSLGSGMETATDGVAINMINVTTPGTHYVRLTATGQDPMVTGDFARCGVAIAPMMP